MRILLSVLCVGLLSACGGGGGDSAAPVVVTPPPPEANLTFEVAVTNLTNAQPLSPPAVVVHNGTYAVFEIGMPASIPLEELAEGGDNSALRSEADGLANVISTTEIDGVVGPGATNSVQFSVRESITSGLSVSVVTMLVNTNDAFTGVNVMRDIEQLQPGESRRVRTIAYDAGTEADSESVGTIPGPADGGEGFNTVRDDEADRVSMHPGVVSGVDGLTTSVLTDQHRFDNPVASVVVTRLN